MDTSDDTRDSYMANTNDNKAYCTAGSMAFYTHSHNNPQAGGNLDSTNRHRHSMNRNHHE